MASSPEGPTAGSVPAQPHYLPDSAPSFNGLRHVFSLLENASNPSMAGLMEFPDEAWPCLGPHPEGVTLKLKVSPNASRTQAGGLWQDRLRLRVQAPPVEGKANGAIIQWACRTFGIRRQAIEMLQGARGSDKVLLMRGLTMHSAAAALQNPDKGGG